MIHANIHASIWQLFLVFYCVHETLELVLVQSCKHLSRNETKNSFWSGGNLLRQNCGESMDFERKSSQMHGEGLGGICVVCAYGPWAQSAHVDVMFIRWRLCLLGGWHRVCWMQWRDAFCVAPHFANVTCFWDFLGVSESCVAQRIHTFCGRGSILVTCVENSWQEQQLMRYVCRRYCEQDLHRFVVLFCFRWWWWCSAVAWWQTCRKSVTTSLGKDVRHRDRWSHVPPILHLKNSAFGLGTNRFFRRPNLHYPMRVGRPWSLSSWFRVRSWRHCGPLLWPHYFANINLNESQIQSQSNGTKLYLVYVYHAMWKFNFIFAEFSSSLCCGLLSKLPGHPNGHTSSNTVSRSSWDEKFRCWFKIDQTCWGKGVEQVGYGYARYALHCPVLTLSW